jgi:hypothetical protein
MSSTTLLIALGIAALCFFGWLALKAFRHKKTPHLLLLLPLLHTQPWLSWWIGVLACILIALGPAWSFVIVSNESTHTGIVTGFRIDMTEPYEPSTENCHNADLWTPRNPPCSSDIIQNTEKYILSWEEPLLHPQLQSCSIFAIRTDKKFLAVGWAVSHGPVYIEDVPEMMCCLQKHYPGYIVWPEGVAPCTVGIS